MSETNPQSSKRMVSDNQVRILLRQLRRESAEYLLNKEQEQTLLLGYHYSKYQSECADILIRHNIRLVRNLINTKYRRNLEIDHADLEVAGIMGLLECVKRWDFSKDVRFSTWAMVWARNKMTNHCISHQSTIRVPHWVIEKMAVIKKSIAKNSLDGKYPSQETIAKDTGISLAHVQHCMEVMSRVMISASESQYKTIDAEEKTHTFVSPFFTDDQLLKETATDNIHRLMASIPQREREMLLLYCGWDGPRMTLEQIGAKYGLSRERIRQIIAMAVARIRGMDINVEDYIHG